MKKTQYNVNLSNKKINALKFLPDGMKEFGLNPVCQKNVKEPQPWLDGMIGNAYFGTIVYIKDPWEEENDETEANNETIVEEDNHETLEDEEFG